MPADVAGLAAPLYEIRERIGTGRAGVASALHGLPAQLRDVGAALTRSAGDTWSGAAAAAADGFARDTVDALHALAGRTDKLAASASVAADAVDRARQRLDAIIADFEGRAATLDASSPAAAEALAHEAQRALDEALAVVDDLAAELDAETDAVRTSPPAAPGPGGHAATPPAGGGMPFGGGAGALTGTAAPLAAAAGSRGGGAPGGPRGGPPRVTPRSDAFGSDLAVRLAGGATGAAPNAVAADAVRHALTQLGVPYDWGGTTPGVGLDCSGLTQWAYREAGLDLPRLAQEQDVGASVDRASLRPGDLAVWDGHVAMIVGDGMMIEAGDPVQLSPVRTTNAGQGFQGFWRPTG
ncbi:C40 family peptidase [Mycolicibacterium grossiae]|uniref:C40 family peptidase n=2 Tax=Mycolicibacterium grossiae TaxID=1552759 RepID=UPI0011F238C7|nr:C40 family peptidase [Mycolicibacterium grossiae]QEM45451.1 NlpC/P60 family protein [Mycolicibacterium grossiae]